MIFVTVGEQLPFDRLIRIVDRWAGDTGEDVIAQIGRSKFVPIHLTCQSFYHPTEFKRLFQSAECIIGHAGMGTIISALDLGKPIIIMPRRQSLGEHRTDHQLATADRFSRLPSITVAQDEKQLRACMSKAQVDHLKQCSGNTYNVGPDPSLIKVIRNFIFQ